MRLCCVLFVVAVTSGGGVGIAAQTPDSLPVSNALPTVRANWTSDRVPLRAGDILTVVINEQTLAQERVSRVASSERSLDLALAADLGSIGRSDLAAGSTVDGRSRDAGDATRTGDLVAVMSVRITDVDANGVFRIEGSKTVTVDGRDQKFMLAGYVRPQDVSSSNVVSSSRLADAEMSYNGDKISPKRGILGKIISIFWP